MKKPTKKEQALIDELEIVLKEKIKVESRLDESLKIYAELEKVTTKLSTKLDMILQSHRLTTQIFSQNQGATWKIKYIQATEQKNFKVI